MWQFLHASLWVFLAQGIRDDVQFHQDLRSREEPNLKDRASTGQSGAKLVASSLTEAEQKIVTATIRRLAMGECQVADAETMKLQSLLEALRGCLDERKKLSAKTRELLKEEKEEGRIYASEVKNIMSLIRRVEDPVGMNKTWEHDHDDAIKQLLERTSEAQKAAEEVWQDNKTSSS
mmetsp:Transcript_17710/g.37070  ORF Transcript_17710/g.37070 Transcript_17710/m.37070 type:complete len:177 (+) Transcript_17710:121-651(+)